MRFPSVGVAAAVCLTACLAGWSCGPQGCPGGGSWRCLNGVTPQWCSVGGGPSGGGDVPAPSDIFSTTPNTYSWDSLESCAAPSTCVLTSDDAMGAMCSLTPMPAPECGGTAFRFTCWHDYPVQCVYGYPTLSSSPVPCSGGCVDGACAVSTADAGDAEAPFIGDAGGD